MSAAVLAYSVRLVDAACNKTDLPTYQMDAVRTVPSPTTVGRLCIAWEASGAFFAPEVAR